MCFLWLCYYFPDIFFSGEAVVPCEVGKGFSKLLAWNSCLRFYGSSVLLGYVWCLCYLLEARSNLSNNIVNSELWIWKEVAVAQVEVLSSIIVDREETSVWIVGLPTGIWTWHHPNHANQKLYNFFDLLLLLLWYMMIIIIIVAHTWEPIPRLRERKRVPWTSCVFVLLWLLTLNLCVLVFCENNGQSPRVPSRRGRAATDGHSAKRLLAWYPAKWDDHVSW
jgi:hypothetical protein